MDNIVPAQIVVAVFLAYYWTGFDMVILHSSMNPVDQPGYVYGPTSGKIKAGALWPYVAYINSELAWHMTCFAGVFVVVGFAYVTLLNFIHSTLLAVLVIGAVRMTPIIGNVLAWPQALISAILWAIISRLPGCKPPSGMDRLYPPGK